MAVWLDSLGLHWGMVSGDGKKIPEALPIRVRTALLPIVGVLVAVCGIFAFVRQKLLTYTLVGTQFVFFDFSEPIPLFYLDWLAMMGTCIFLAHCGSALLHRLSSPRKTS